MTGMTAQTSEATPPERPHDRTPRRAALLAGPAQALVLLGGILLAAYVFTPTASFSWRGEVSQFGELRHQSIALGGLLGLVFLWPVWQNATNRLQHFGIGVFAIAWLITGGANALAVAGIGVGDWAVFGLILLFPFALLIYGGGDIYAGGNRRRGSMSLLLGGLYVLNVWLLLPFPPAPGGYALIGYVGSFVLVATWALLMYLMLRA